MRTLAFMPEVMTDEMRMLILRANVHSAEHIYSELRRLCSEQISTLDFLNADSQIGLIKELLVEIETLRDDLTNSENSNIAVARALADVEYVGTYAKGVEILKARLALSESACSDLANRIALSDTARRDIRRAVLLQAAAWFEHKDSVSEQLRRLAQDEEHG